MSDKSEKILVWGEASAMLIALGLTGGWSRFKEGVIPLSHLFGEKLFDIALGRVAQAFDLAGISRTMGCPVLRVFCEGRVPRQHTQPGLCRTDKSCVGSIAAHPCKERKDRAPSVGVLPAKIVKGLPPTPSLRDFVEFAPLLLVPLNPRRQT